MVPFGVGEVRHRRYIHIARLIAEQSVSELYLHCDGVAHRRTEEGDGVRFVVIAAEPAHERIVLRLGTREEGRLESNGCAVGYERDALRLGP